MKRLGWIVRLVGVVLITMTSIEARQIPQADIRLHSYDASSVIGRPATMVEFGGYSTPKCRLALSDEGRLFYLTKVHSTCRKLTNRNGIRIICNSNKSVCKTRSELSAFVRGGNDAASSDSPRPSWCRSSRLNRTERTICSHDTLASLDLKLAQIYGSQRSRSNDRAQGYWLRHRRNACGSDVSCIARAYRERIRELGGQGRPHRASQNVANHGDDGAIDLIGDGVKFLSGLTGAIKHLTSGSSRSRSGGSSSSSIQVCVPAIPYQCCKSHECQARSASGNYSIVKLTKNLTEGCYELSVHDGPHSGVGNTCGGLDGSWSVGVSTSGIYGSAQGLSSAIAWILERI